MQDIYKVLFNDLLEQVEKDTHHFFLHEKSIDRWFNDIHLANYKESIKTIYLSLHRTNKIIIPYKQRLYFLEKLHTSIFDLTEHLKKGNLHRSFPLNEKQKRASLLIQNMHNQMVMGYKYVLRDLVECHSFLQCPKKKQNMTLVIERMMRHHSVYLMSIYQFYQSPIKGQWADIHHLFLLAHNEDLLHKKVNDRSFFMVKKTTIKNIYLQIVLLAIADPYNLSQLHIELIFNQLEEWAALAKIQQYQEQQEKEALVINLSKDHQPTFINLNTISNADSLWELCTLKLNKTSLNEYLDEKNCRNIAINQELLERISSSWKVSSKRNQDRNSSHSTDVNMIIGLNHIHNMFYNTPLNKDDYNSHYHSHTIELTTSGRDIWKDAFQYKSASDTQNDLLQASSNITSHQELHEWKIVNKSLEGYSLLWEQTGESINNAKVGKVIALCHKSDTLENTWLVGTIRWLKCIANNKIQVGIHIIGSNPQAVHISKALNNDESLKSRSILLPEDPILNQPCTLITTALGYKENEQIILDGNFLIDGIPSQTQSKILLVKCLESSSHFLKFTYQFISDHTIPREIPVLLESNDKSTKENDPLSLTDIEYDDMWGDL